jgi:uncharacterized membrane protein YeaQ/YmgE (transglycosylase-associated protein family)
MSLIVFLIVGLVAGFLARAIVPGRDPMGVLGTLVLGVGGALLGGFLASAIFDDDAIGIIGATIGAVILLLIYNAVTRRGRSTV